MGSDEEVVEQNSLLVVFMFVIGLVILVFSLFDGYDYFFYKDEVVNVQGVISNKYVENNSNINVIPVIGGAIPIYSSGRDKYVIELSIDGVEKNCYLSDKDVYNYLCVGDKVDVSGKILDNDLNKLTDLKYLSKVSGSN